MSGSDNVWSRERQEILEALDRVPPGNGTSGRPTRPAAILVAVIGLWARATLRLPMLVFAWFYVSRGVAIAERSRDFPDGAFFVWFYYTISEVDNVLSIPAAWLVNAGIGWNWAQAWLLAYSIVTVGYVVGGLLVWRGGRSVRRLYRAGIVYLVTSVAVHVLTLIAVVPGAVDAINTGENAPVYPYTGMNLVRAYEWMLLPWALALLAVTVAIIASLRATSTRVYIGVSASPTSDLEVPRR